MTIVIEKLRPKAAMNEAAIAERMPLAAVELPVKINGTWIGPNTWSSQTQRRASNGPPREMRPGTNQKPFRRSDQRALISFTIVLNILPSFDHIRRYVVSTVIRPRWIQAQVLIVGCRLLSWLELGCEEKG